MWQSKISNPDVWDSNQCLCVDGKNGWAFVLSSFSAWPWMVGFLCAAGIENHCFEAFQAIQRVQFRRRTMVTPWISIWAWVQRTIHRGKDGEWGRLNGPSDNCSSWPLISILCGCRHGLGIRNKCPLGFKSSSNDGGWHGTGKWKGNIEVEGWVWEHRVLRVILKIQKQKSQSKREMRPACSQLDAIVLLSFKEALLK